jgi:hypothetical protein
MMKTSMSISALLTALMITGLAACSQPTEESPAPESLFSSTAVELSAGTSFGMCAGYCITELVVGAETVRFKELGHPFAELPEKARTLPLSPDDAERFFDLVDVAEMERLEGVHGCPDCADGGAEWIEVRTDDGPVRVTFEYGRPPAGITRLHAAIRAQRERFR